MSPYYIPSKEITPLPNPTCNVTTTSILIRHSAIMSNDDDREQFMQPFIDRVASWRNNSSEDHGVFPVPPEGWKLEDQVEGWKKDGVYDGDVGVRKWWFLNEWETPVKEEIDEKLSERGKEDAFVSFTSLHVGCVVSCLVARADGWCHLGSSPLLGLWTSDQDGLLSSLPRPAYG